MSQAVLKVREKLFYLTHSNAAMARRRWTAPPLAGIAPAGSNCHDRPCHRYNNPCSSLTNPLIPPFLWPQILPAGTPLARRACQRAALHGNAHEVCAYCQLDIALLPWMQQAFARMSRPPPAAETNRWRGFWTRLCRECEEAEQIMVHRRLGNLPHPYIAPPGPTNMNLMVGYPRSTCTCIGRLKNWYLCIRHRRETWDAIRPNMVADRNATMAWLRTVAWHGPSGTLQTASPAMNARRDTTIVGGPWLIPPGVPNTAPKYRACRCGEEVVDHAAAQVYICLVCLGTIEVTAMPIAAIPPLPFTPRQLQNRQSTPALYNIPRLHGPILVP